MEPGIKIDRYGKFGGYFVAQRGTPYENRALIPGTSKSPYNIFEVNQSFEAKSGRIASWFNEPGGGIQYKFDEEILDLLKQNKIKIIDYT